MKHSIASLVVLSMAFAGCGSDDEATDDDAAPADTTAAVSAPTTDEQKADSMTTISGKLTYRPRIALIPGGTATVTLNDTSKQDVAADVIEEADIELGDQQVPIPFELTADTSGLDERGMYSLRATITGPGGDLQWTTDTANLIDVTQQQVDLGTVELVQVQQNDTGDSDDASSSPIVGEWTVVDIDGASVIEDATPTLVFGADGSLGGNAGCNSYSTTHSTGDGELTIGSELAVTLMACDPDTDEQEAAFLEVVRNAATFEIADDGATLTITSTDGRSVSAEK